MNDASALSKKAAPIIYPRPRSYESGSRSINGSLKPMRRSVVGSRTSARHRRIGEKGGRRPFLASYQSRVCEQKSSSTWQYSRVVDEPTGHRRRRRRPHSVGVTTHARYRHVTNSRSKKLKGMQLEDQHAGRSTSQQLAGIKKHVSDGRENGTEDRSSPRALIGRNQK